MLGIPGKLIGVVLMFGAVLILFLVPWLDTSPVRSARFRPIYRIISWFLVIDAIVLGYVGSQLPQGAIVTIGQIATAYYFIHFLILMPLIGKIETPRPLPLSIGAAVLGPGAARRPMPRRRRESDMRTFAIAALVASLVLIGGVAAPARAQEETPEPPSQHWSFDGVFGTYRPGRAATRLPGVQGGVLRLPPPAVCAISAI